MSEVWAVNRIINTVLSLWFPVTFDDDTKFFCSSSRASSAIFLLQLVVHLRVWLLKLARVLEERNKIYRSSEM